MSSSPDLVVIGDCNADLIVGGADTVPEYGQHEKLVESARLVLGGSGAITAAQASKLGVPTAFVGVVGDDVLGEWCIAELAGTGVDVSGCVIESGASTGVTVVLGGGDVAGDRAMLTFPGAMALLEASRVRTDLVTGARHLHFSSYFLHPAMARGVPVLAAAARRNQATTSLDPNWDPSGSWDGGIMAALASVDILFANEAEAIGIARACGRESATDLAEDGTAVVVKKGAAGAVLSVGPLSRSVSYPLEGEVAVDSTGAGDSFDAGFIAGKLAGLEEAESLLLACFCGMRVVAGLGGTATQPTFGEVLDVLGYRL